MALKDLQKHVEKGGKKIKELANKARKAAIGVAVAASTVVPSLAAEKTGNDNSSRPESEQTAEASAVGNEASAIDLFGTPIVQEHSEEGTITRINNATISPNKLDDKEIAREWKREQRDLLKNAEPDVRDTVTVDVANRYYGGAYAIFDDHAKNITTLQYDLENSNLEQKRENFLNRQPEDQKETAIELWNSVINVYSELNNTSSVTARSVRTHEEQHRANDKLGIYAPGLSPEQYVLLTQYDEASASIAQLNCIVTDYKKALAAGQTKEEALKVFDTDLDQHFTFYKDSLAAGLDPDSKEGKQLMVQGTIKMWEQIARPRYKRQLVQPGLIKLNRSDAAATILGNEQELQKRIDKIFNNICKNDYCKQNGIKSPGNLTKYLPDKQMELEPDVKQYIANAVEGKTGLDAESREQIAQAIPGNTGKKQIKNLLKILTGRKSPEDVAARKAKPGKEQTKTVSYEQLAQMQQENTY